MNKILLIIKREYITRVRTRAFIIATVLAPVFIGVLLFAQVFLAMLDSDVQTRIAIIDQTGAIAERLKESRTDQYFVPDVTELDSLRAQTIDEDITGYLIIREDMITGEAKPEFVSMNAGFQTIESIENDIERAIRDELLDRSAVATDVKASLGRNIQLETSKLSKTGEEEEDNTGVLFVTALIMAFSIYMAMFIYGTTIMRSVLQEKTNRIVELMVSSVKPFELILGKVLGVGAVGLTQFILWTGAAMALTAFAAPIIAMVSGPPDPAAVEASSGFTMPEIPIGVWFFFVISYLLGYLMFGALFAAVGSAADSDTDVQQLTLPISIFIIIPILMLGKVASDPNSTIAVVSSMIPLFSPILMLARVAATDVPLWQSLGSVVLMVLSFLGFIWVGARIYRTGILMYGKKVSFKEMLKWVRQSG